MKVYSKICLTIFSVIILAISIIGCFVISGWIEVDVIADLLKEALTNKTGNIIALAISILLALLSTISIFAMPYSKDSNSEGILLENEHGKLLVSKDTIENISSNVIRNFDSIENSSTKVDVDKENKINIFITLSVYQEAIIKDLASKIQEDIKAEVKKSLDLEIKEVNIRIKNVNRKKENVIKE